MFCFPQDDVVLPSYSQILKDIASSHSTALTVVGRNVDVGLRDVLLAMRGFDVRLQNVQGNLLASNPSAGLFPQELPLKLFDAIGRELNVPAYLAGSFDVSDSIIPTYLGLFC
jgi:hypothetical protein